MGQSIMKSAAEYLLLGSQLPAPITTLLPLTTKRMVFDAGGKPWRWVFADAFLLPFRIWAGQDVTNVLNWYQRSGFNGLRCFHNAVIMPPKPGRDLPPGAVPMDIVTTTQRMINDRGMYVEWTGGDFQLNMPDHNQQRKRLELLAAQLGNNLLEYCNEPFKNGMDVARMMPFPSIIQSSGNYRLTNAWQGTYMLQTMEGVQNYFTRHSERKAEWPRLSHDAMEFYEGWRGTVDSGPHKGEPERFFGVGVPYIDDEMVGADEVMDPWSRSNVPADFFDKAAGDALFSAGSTFHSTAGIDSVIPGPITEECARQFVLGHALIPLDAPFGEYTRGGRANCPIEHSDTTALRTYAMMFSNRATVVVVRPTKHTAADRIPRNGWRVVKTAGDRHNVVYLER